MKSFVVVAPLAALLVCAALANRSFAQPPDILRDYRFLPSHSGVHVTGGSPGYDIDLSILGKFGLVTGYDYTPSPTAHIPTLTPFAEFVNVHAILFNPLSAAPIPVPGWDLDKTLNLSGLSGTFSDPSVLHFTGVDGQGIPIKLDATLRGPLLHLTGQNYLPPTCFTCAQYVGYKVDALAVAAPYADFNLDGVVDAADYAIWRTNIGGGSNDSVEQGDATGDGSVDAADYVTWRRSVGPAIDLGAFLNSENSASMVPEPATLGLAFAFLGLIAVRATGRDAKASTRANGDCRIGFAK